MFDDSAGVERRRASRDIESQMLDLFKAQYDFARDSCEPVFGFEHDKHREIIDHRGRLTYEGFSRYKADRLRQVKTRYFPFCEPNDLTGRDASELRKWLDCQETALRRARENSRPDDALSKKIGELRAEIIRLDPSSPVIASASAPTRQAHERLVDEVERLRDQRASQEANIRAALERKFWSEVSGSDRSRLSINAPESPAKEKLRRELTAMCAEFVERTLRSHEKLTNEEHALKLQELWSFRAHRPGGKCPSCGACLVSRTRKNDGVSFVGCSSFPGCTFAWSAMWGATRDGKFVAEEEDVTVTVESIRNKLSSTMKEQRAPRRSGSEEDIAACARILSKVHGPASAGSLAKKAGFDSSMRLSVSPGLSQADAATELWEQLLTAAREEGRDEALFSVLKKDAENMPLVRSQVDDAFAAWRPLCTFVDAGSKNASNSEGDAMGQPSAADKDKKDSAEKAEKTDKLTVAGILGAVATMTKEDTEDAAWRTAADEATEIVKPGVRKLAQGAAKMSPAFSKFLVNAIDTPIGEGVVAWVTGIAIVGYGPLRGKTLGTKTLRLSKELRVKGIKPITDLVAKKIISPVRKELTDLIMSLPDVIDDLI